MSEVLMTEANQPNEGNASQQPVEAAETEQSVGVEDTGNQQQAEGATEQQAQDGAAVEDTSDQAGAPEKYEFNTEVADAPQALDGEVVDAFADVAKDLNLSQDAAQKVLDKMAPVIQARQAKALEGVKAEWGQQSAADQEFGGEALAGNLDVAKKSLDAFGTDALRSLLHESGLGNHPEVIRFMYRAGKAISEDSYVGSSQGAEGASKAAPKDFAGLADALYSNQQT